MVIPEPEAFHDYTASFLAYLIWDPVHMYNAVTNGWTDFEHQITFDVRQPKTRAFTMERLRKFIADYPYVDVIRYTTFFHQFTLIFDELKREKYVDWYGYSASVSPYILERFEREAGYPFRPEFIIDQGYYNNQYRTPTKEYQDFVAFQRREVAALAKEMVDITHELGRETMMFLGDHWIGTEPYLDEFRSIGLDAVVGSVGNGATLRLISDIQGVRYTEGRFLPYFFPDTFHEGGDPVGEARENWVTARRAILRKPVDRIGYGGYLKLACRFPDFTDYVESVCNDFRELYDSIKGAKPYCVKTVAVLNSWGKARSWGCHMVHHALYQKQNYSCAGAVDFGEGKKSIYALHGTQVLVQRDKEVQMAVNEYGAGRGVYISGLPYSFENSRLLHRAVLWSTHSEEEMERWLSANCNVDVHAYVDSEKFCVVNNTYELQSTTVYRGDGSSFPLRLAANEIRWFEI